MTFAIDEQSLLVQVPATATLRAIEDALSARNLTLGVLAAGASDAADEPVGVWLARSAPSHFADPADHLIAGLRGRLVNGKTILIKPSPRRSVGPDLVALFAGAQDRFGSIESVWLRVHRNDATRPLLPLPKVDLDPPVNAGEAELLDAIARALRS